jgi:NodT family efflux transporter outer membrane factor (OMF) lipoprotein
MKSFYTSFVFFTLSAFAILSTLSGCSWRMPEHPTGVQMDVPEKFSESKRVDAGTPKAQVSALWWRVLEDPVLDQLQEFLARENPNLISLAAVVEQAKAAVAAAQSNLWPDLNANTGVARSQSYLTAPSGTYISQSFPFTWTPDIWGAMDAQIIALKAQQESSEESLSMARLTAQATLMQSYLTLRNVEKEQATLIDAVNAYTKALEITQSRYLAGVAASTDVSQAKLQLSNTKAQSIDLGIQRAQLLHSIAALVGKTPSSLNIEPTAAAARPVALPDIIPGDLLKRRPDIRAAMRNVESAQASLGATKLAFFPVVTFSSSLGYRSTQLPGLIGRNNAYWSLGPNLSLPLFDGGQRQANKRSAQAGLDQAVAAYRQVVLAALQEVEDNLAATSLLQEEGAVQAEALTAAQKNLQATKDQYLFGTVGYLNVINAQTSELQARRAVMDIENRRWLAITQLLKNLAGQWDTAQVQPKALHSSDNQ